MKKSFLLYLIISVFLIGYCACDNDEENFDTATTGQVIKVPDDIKSFNSVTRNRFREEYFYQARRARQ